jgi:hypothetical protein
VDGRNEVSGSLFIRNGAASISSHTLFSLDNGVAEFSENNATHNFVSGGYAGGHIGWFSQSAVVKFSAFASNVGKSVFGSCAYSPEHSGTSVTSVLFLRNYATKYGVFMRHTGSQTLVNAFFFWNVGPAFYGTAPLTVQRSFFDCHRPHGPIIEDTVAWNYAVKPNLPPMKLGKLPGDLEDEVKEKDGDVEVAFAQVAKKKAHEEAIRRAFRKRKAPQPAATTLALKELLKNASLPRKKQGQRKVARNPTAPHRVDGRIQKSVKQDHAGPQKQDLEDHALPKRPAKHNEKRLHGEEKN